MPKKYKVVVSTRADRSLVKHAKFVGCDSPVAAHKLVMDYYRLLRSIGANPFQFPMANNDADLAMCPNIYRRCLLGKYHKILFRVDGQEVFIAIVLDSRSENQDLTLD